MHHEKKYYFVFKSYKKYNYKKRSIKNNQNENIGIFTVFQSDNFKIDPFFEISNRE